jgi:hypothetical protein
MLLLGAALRCSSAASCSLLGALVCCFGDAVLSDQGLFNPYSSNEMWQTMKKTCIPLCRPAHSTPKGVAERKGPGRCDQKLCKQEYPRLQIGSRLSLRSRLRKCQSQKGHRYDSKISRPNAILVSPTLARFRRGHRLIYPILVRATKQNKKAKSKQTKQQTQN